MSGIREKDHRFVFNTTTDGSVSVRSSQAPNLKEISQRNALQIAGLPVASRPLGKIGEIWHLGSSQELRMQETQTDNEHKVSSLFTGTESLCSRLHLALCERRTLFLMFLKQLYLNHHQDISQQMP